MNEVKYFPSKSLGSRSNPASKTKFKKTFFDQFLKKKKSRKFDGQKKNEEIFIIITTRNQDSWLNQVLIGTGLWVESKLQI